MFPARMCALVLAFPSVLFSAPKLSPLFSDHMVLQRDQPVRIRGEAEPSAAVTVEVGGVRASETAGPDGQWTVELPAFAAGGPYDLEVRASGGQTTVRDVLFGDVWLCAGQSNMDFRLAEEFGGDLEKAERPDVRVRYLRIDPCARLEPRSGLSAPEQKAGWQTADHPDRVSAVAWHFAQAIRDTVDVPIGLIIAAWGGTPISAWVPVSELETRPFARDWLADREKVKARLESEPGLFPYGPDVRLQTRPGTVFDGMIHPLGPLALRGILWYQGEQNAGTGKEVYTPLMEILASSWRAQFQAPKIPLFFVQLPRFADRHEGSWPKVREAQLHALSIPDSGMAVAIDLGESHQIHPADKRDVGRRLARLALSRTYKVPLLEDSGPLPEAFSREGAAFRVRFRHAASGLLPRDGGDLREFEIAGNDRVFRPASTWIDGASVLVWNSEVIEPVAVRHAWKNDPDVNLVNRAGLPASPFRSDDWPNAEASGWRLPPDR